MRQAVRRSGSGMRSIAASSSFGSRWRTDGPTKKLQPIMLNDGPSHWSMNFIHQRIRQRSRGSSGISDGPSNAASTYSMIAVDSVSTRSPCSIAGIVPCGLIGEIFGLVLIEVQHVDIVAVELHALFGEGEHRLAAIGIGLPVEQGDLVAHLVVSPLPISPSFVAAACFSGCVKLGCNTYKFAARVNAVAAGWNVPEYAPAGEAEQRG